MPVPVDLTRGRERRRYFRIRDRVALSLVPIAPEAEKLAIGDLLDSASSFGLINDLRALRDRALPRRKQIESKFPTVAAYLDALERQIDLLANAINRQDGAIERPTRDISLSAQGLSTHWEEPLPEGALVEVWLVLFPEHARIKALGRVVACSDPAPAATGAVATAVEFTHLRGADREAIVRHVHALQLQRLQSGVGMED